MVGKRTPDDILTASVIPVAANLSPYRTPNDQLAKALAVEAMVASQRHNVIAKLFLADDANVVVGCLRLWNGRRRYVVGIRN